MKVEAGQLRRWNEDLRELELAGKTFLIIESGFEISEALEEDPTWTYILGGRRMWDFEQFIIESSEAIE